MSDSPEFLSEAQELLESFSGQLFQIEGQIKEGDEYDPDLLNGAFRSVHTLKGLSSMAGGREIVEFSHKLENCLDELRLGKLPVNQRALDLLFESVDLFTELLQGMATSEDGSAGVDVAPFLLKLDKLSQVEEESTDDPLSWLDDSILGVLTEYEEHRLRENVRLGRSIFKVHASFDLLSIDQGLSALKTKLKVHGEVITYLPSADGSSDDRIELDILLGSKQVIAIIAEGIGEPGVVVESLSSGERITITADMLDAPAPRELELEPTPEPTPAPSRAKVEAIEDDDFPEDDDGDTGGGVAPAGGSGSAPNEGPQDPSPPDASGGGADGGGADGGGADGSGADAADPAGDGGGDMSVKSLSQTVRVDLRRLDHLMNLVGELALVHANLGGIGERMRRGENLGDYMREFQDQLRVMSRRLGLLQQGILEVRMVPLGQVFDRLARVVRNFGRKLEKDVRLSITGGDTELDKLIVEELSDPLLHMIRNAIDHGIEKPAERVAVGKPRAGRINLSAYQKGNRVVIELTDDGKGMDWRQIRDKAVSKGFVTREEASDIGPSQAINMIFTPGFSTKQEASELSGRGVGMDVVKTNIARLSGMIDVASEPGRGSRFRITLPITLAIIQALVIETAGQTFCIPLNSVLESIMVQSDEIQTIEGHEVVSVRGQTLPLIHLSRVFELEPEGREAERRMFYDRLYVVVVGLAQHRVGLVVDELLGQQDVVIKDIGTALRQVPGIAGATELGDNRTVLLLDVGTLVGEAVGGVEAAVSGAGREGIGVFSTLNAGRENEYSGLGDHGI